MINSFKDNFNYLIAFIAVLVGLSAFKDFATAHTLDIFTFQISYLYLSIPLIIAMLLAAYLGALAMLSKNINFTLFPLTRYLENTSYFVATIGLLYPTLVFLAWLFTLLSSLVLNKDLLYIAQLLVTLQGVMLLALAKKLTVSKQQQSIEYGVGRIRSISEGLENEKPVKKLSKEAQFLKFYEEVSESARFLLKLHGYGIAKENLHRTAQMLSDKKIFNLQDVQQATEITRLRNTYAHTGEGLSRQYIESLTKKLERLRKKIDEAAYRYSN